MDKEAQDLNKMMLYWIRTLQAYAEKANIQLDDTQAIDFIKKSMAFAMSRHSEEVWQYAMQLAGIALPAYTSEQQAVPGAEATPKGQKITQERIKYLQDIAQKGQAFHNLTQEELLQLHQMGIDLGFRRSSKHPQGPQIEWS